MNECEICFWRTIRVPNDSETDFAFTRNHTESFSFRKSPKIASGIAAAPILFSVWVFKNADYKFEFKINELIGNDGSNIAD